jgi:hypothetical protein
MKTRIQAQRIYFTSVQWRVHSHQLTDLFSYTVIMSACLCRDGFSLCRRSCRISHSGVVFRGSWVIGWLAPELTIGSYREQFHAGGPSALPGAHDHQYQLAESDIKFPQYHRPTGRPKGSNKHKRKRLKI